MGEFMSMCKHLTVFTFLLTIVNFKPVVSMIPKPTKAKGTRSRGRWFIE